MGTGNLTRDTFEFTIADNPLVLVDFWAGYYRPCQAFAPVYVGGGKPIPTIMASRDGVLVCGQPGAMPSAVLENLITQVKALDMTAGRAKIATRTAG